MRSSSLPSSRTPAIGRRWRAGSTRTPTRPESCRSARRRSGRGARDKAAHFRRSCVELGREKHRRGLEDLVRAPQLIDLTPQPLALLALGRRRQIRAQALIGPRPDAVLAQRLRRHTEIARHVRDRAVALKPAARRGEAARAGTSSGQTSADPRLPPGQIISASRSPSRPSLAQQATLAGLKGRRPARPYTDVGRKGMAAGEHAAKVAV